MNTQYEKANEILIKMFNAEVAELKSQYPSFGNFGSIHHNTPDEIATVKEYEAKHHEIYARYNIIWAAIR